MYALSLLVFDTKDPTDVYLELKQVHLALLEQVTRLGRRLQRERGANADLHTYAAHIRSATIRQLVDGTSARCLLRADKATT